MGDQIFKVIFFCNSDSLQKKLQRECHSILQIFAGTPQEAGARRQEEMVIGTLALLWNFLMVADGMVPSGAAAQKTKNLTFSILPVCI